MADTSFRDCEDSSSTRGYVIKLFGDTIMSNACQEIVSLDKAIRDITGKTVYPVTLWCDNKSAVDCTQMEGNHKLKNFDDDLETIQRKLQDKEKVGSKSHMMDIDHRKYGRHYEKTIA